MGEAKVIREKGRQRGKEVMLKGNGKRRGKETGRGDWRGVGLEQRCREKRVEKKRRDGGKEACGIRPASPSSPRPCYIHTRPKFLL